VRVHQRQTAGLYPGAHHLFTLIALTHVKRRRVDDGQQLGACGFGEPGGFFEPGILTNQQSHFDLVTCLAGFKHAHALAWREVATLVKHLVIRQLTFGIGSHHGPLTQNTGCVMAVRHRHRTGSAITPARVADHHRHILQPSQFAGHGLHGIVAGSNEGRAQKQVFRRIAANGEFRRQQQTHPVSVG
jgi:hypothetical protein